MKESEDNLALEHITSCTYNMGPIQSTKYNELNINLLKQSQGYTLLDHTEIKCILP